MTPRRHAPEEPEDDAPLFNDMGIAFDSITFGPVTEKTPPLTGVAKAYIDKLNAEGIACKHGTVRGTPTGMEWTPHHASEASPPHNRMPTSVAAAASKVSDAATERARVYMYIASRGAVGATREEIEDALHMPGNTVRPRVWELMGNGGHVARIREAGVVRLTRSGRRAEVLVII